MWRLGRYDSTHNRSKHLLRVSSGRPGSRYIVVQSLGHIWLFGTKWTAARQASLSFSLLEFAQAHVHRVGDAIQPSHPLSPSYPPAFNLSQHQGLFRWVGWLLASGGQSVGASTLLSVLPMNVQGWCPSGLAGLQQSWNVFHCHHFMVLFFHFFNKYFLSICLCQELYGLYKLQ